MMTIKRIKVKDFRAVREVDFMVSEDSDVIAVGGLNGSGKTSLLEAIMWAFNGQFRNQLRGPLPDQDFCVEVDLTMSADVCYRIRSTRNGDECLRSEGWKDGFVPMKTGELRSLLSDIRAFYFSSWREPKRVGALGMTIGRKGKRPAATSSNALWNLKQLLVNLQGFSGYDSGRGTSDRVKGLFNRLNWIWSRFYPDDGGEFYADVAKTSQASQGDEDEMAFDVFLKRRSVERPIAVDDLSSGEIEILAFFGTILIEEYRRHKPYDFLFLDEPELHLSRAWHRLILPVLKEVSPGTQILVATHSSDVWESVYPGQRLLMRGGWRD